MQYDRMTEDEKLEMYLTLESDLLVFDQTKNELEIDRLREENQTIEQLKKEMKELKKNQAIQDEKIIQTLKNQGSIP
jgi:hypothetical protein